MASPAPPSEQLLDDVRRFLRVTLNQELLSPTSEKQRQDLLQRLSTREQSPGSYLDMNCCKKSYNAEISRDFQEFYEAFEPDDLKSARRRSDISFLKSSELHNELNINKDNYVTKNVHRKSLNSVLSSELILGSERLQDRKPSSTGSTTGTNMNGINGLNSPNSVASSVKSDSLSSSTSTIPQESDGERGANSSEVLSISASALKYSAIKHGVLARKERVLKAFEKVRKYWVGVLGHSLYIYTSEKDLRPTTVIDILGYSARPVSVKDPPNSSPKKDYTFEIVCPGKKTYQFIASNWSEMETWILIISQAGNQPTPLPSPTVAPSSNGCFLNERSLPATPVSQFGPEQIYDEPDSKVRPVEKYPLNNHVSPVQWQQYEFMSDDSFYHYIDDTMKENLKNMKNSCLCSQQNENYYNNVGEGVRHCMQCDNRSNMYYNMLDPPDSGRKENHLFSCSSLPSIPTEQEAIYDIILDGQKQQINGITDRDKLLNEILNRSKEEPTSKTKPDEQTHERTDSTRSSDGNESDRSSKENADFNVQKSGLLFVNQYGPNRIQDIINRIETTYNNKREPTSPCKREPAPANKRFAKSGCTTTLPKRTTLCRSLISSPTNRFSDLRGARSSRTSSTNRFKPRPARARRRTGSLRGNDFCCRGSPAETGDSTNRFELSATCSSCRTDFLHGSDFCCCGSSAETGDSTNRF
ncbi:unnamed protein product [Bemisia tabaci]|uniref:PH domain-containing protein n=1 Tax=Bemisia tabaci TaxID=7038 RepID=A0A9P0CHA8_BEMTA|nr:unnamed protein product [Bemisia tabaci]